MENATRPRSDDLREVVWRVLLAAGSGSLVGLVIGGIGGRLVMLVLRLTSDHAVRGINTDDGFTIGQFTTATTFLLVVTAGLGAATGIGYLVLRGGLPRSARALVWGVFLALLTGADVLKPGELDFTLLGPKTFSVVSFILLPGLAAFAIALVMERLLVLEPWSDRRLTVVLALAALPLVPVLPVAVLAVLVLLAVRRVPSLAARMPSIGKVVVPVVLVGLSVRAGIELWRDVNAIL